MALDFGGIHSPHLTRYPIPGPAGRNSPIGEFSRGAEMGFCPHEHRSQCDRRCDSALDKPHSSPTNHGPHRDNAGACGRTSIWSFNLVVMRPSGLRCRGIPELLPGIADRFGTMTCRIDRHPELLPRQFKNHGHRP